MKTRKHIGLNLKITEDFERLRDSIQLYQSRIFRSRTGIIKLLKNHHGQQNLQQTKKNLVNEWKKLSQKLNYPMAHIKKFNHYLIYSSKIKNLRSADKYLIIANL